MDASQEQSVPAEASHSVFADVDKPIPTDDTESVPTNGFDVQTEALVLRYLLLMFLLLLLLLEKGRRA